MTQKTAARLCGVSTTKFAEFERQGLIKNVGIGFGRSKQFEASDVYALERKLRKGIKEL